MIWEKKKEWRGEIALDILIFKPLLWDYIKLKTSSKDTINRMKKQDMEWEKILANHVTDMLISRI